MKADQGVRNYWINLVVLRAEEECRLEGERDKNKQTNTRVESWERTPSTHQRNEAIGVEDLVMNSRRLSYGSSCDGLWPLSIQSCTCQARLSQTERCCLLSLSEDGSGWRGQPEGSRIIYKCFQEFTAFLNCGYKTLIISWSSVGMHAWPIHKRSPSQPSVLRKTSCVTKPRQEICSCGWSYLQHSDL